MAFDPEHLVTLQSQVAELNRAIAHQERVIAELRRLGEPTVLAEKFLARLRARLTEHQSHLDAIDNTAANDGS